MNAIEILRAASRSVPNEDYVQFMAAVDAVEELIASARKAAGRLPYGPEREDMYVALANVSGGA